MWFILSRGLRSTNWANAKLKSSKNASEGGESERGEGLLCGGIEDGVKTKEGGKRIIIGQVRRRDDGG